MPLTSQYPGEFPTPLENLQLTYALLRLQQVALEPIWDDPEEDLYELEQG